MASKVRIHRENQKALHFISGLSIMLVSILWYEELSPFTIFLGLFSYGIATMEISSVFEQHREEYYYPMSLFYLSYAGGIVCSAFLPKTAPVLFILSLALVFISMVQRSRNRPFEIWDISSPPSIDESHIKGHAFDVDGELDADEELRMLMQKYEKYL